MIEDPPPAAVNAADGLASRRTLRSRLRPLVGPFVASYVGADTTEPIVAFTFDDGPDPAYTPGVLDVLRSHGGHATFFVLGDEARRHPELVRRVVAEGHEVALHSSSHRAMTDLTLIGRAVALQRGRREVRRAAGRRPRWFRAPYGKQTPDTVVVSRLLGMRPVMWSAYACEWEDRPLSGCVAHAAPGITQGGILLLHDGAAGENDRPARPAGEIVALVDELLRVARSRGLDVVPVGELMRRGSPRRRLWFRSWCVDVV